MITNQKMDKVGLIAGAGAFVSWGILPLYFIQLAKVGSLEVLGHRVIWSTLVLLILIFYKGRQKLIIEVLQSKGQLLWLGLASFFISVNWLTYIYAVSNGRNIDASLGYFINPILMALLGVVTFKERLSLSQKSCLFFAVIGVAYQIISSASFSWVSLALPLSFSCYGLIKKRLNVHSLVGLFIETLFLAPFVLAYFYYLSTKGLFYFQNSSLGFQFLLAMAGVITAIPLFLFSEGAKRLPMVVIGLMQYIAPSLQFMIGLYVFKEPFNQDKMFGFSLVWLGLIILVLGEVFKLKTTRARAAV